MSVLTKLKGAERQKALDVKRERANERWQEKERKKVFSACRKMIREEVPQLNGKKINDCHITVKKIIGGYRVFTTGFGYDQERTLEITLDSFSGRFRPADEAPEQDWSSQGIRIKWWRRGARQTSDEMSDAVMLDIGAVFWEENLKKDFQERLAGHVKRCVGLDRD